MRIEDIVKIVFALGGSANVGLLIVCIFRYCMRNNPKTTIVKGFDERGNPIETHKSGY